MKGDINSVVIFVAVSVGTLSKFTVEPVRCHPPLADRFHLTPTELASLSISYFQNGLLFSHPATPGLVSRHKSSALVHFRPLASCLTS